MAYDALNALNPSMPREQWVRIGFAFKDAGGSEEEWLEWCEGGANFNKADAISTWRNAKDVPGGVTAATLYMEAHKAGHTPGLNGQRVDMPPAAPRKVRKREEPRAPFDDGGLGEPVVVDPHPIWDAALPVVKHDYLTAKGIAAHGARVTEAGMLVVPYVNARRELQTLQFISGSGEKRFLKGARQKGSVALVGDPQGATAIAVVEGFATACTIAEAPGYVAMAAGSRTVMETAAQIARAFAPRGRVVIAMDVGDATIPIRAARATGAVLAVPGPMGAADGYDFNDWRRDGATEEDIRERLDTAQAPALPADASPANASAAVPPAEKSGLTRIEPTAPAVDYVVNAKGMPVANLANVTTYLISGALGAFSFDTFTGVALWDGRPLDDAMLADITAQVQRRAVMFGAFVFARIATNVVADAVMLATRAGSFNSNVQWLDGLPAWDGVERITQFFCDVAGAAPTDYVQGVGRYFWLSLVSRMVEPGCKADMAAVLIGLQGVGKSTLGRIIGGERYGEASLARIGERDWLAELRGKIIVELSELSGHTRAEIETIKAVMSRQVDEYRSAYGRVVQSHPRGCVFYGTTNDREFLSDPTGNRRWLPVESNGALRLDIVGEMRGQYFAEAYAHVVSGVAGDYWRVPGAVDEQAEHVARDPWVDLLDAKLRDHTTLLPVLIENNVVYEALKIPTDRQTGGGTGKRIAFVMRELGYTRARWYPTKARQVRGFVRATMTVEAVRDATGFLVSVA